MMDWQTVSMSSREKRASCLTRQCSRRSDSLTSCKLTSTSYLRLPKYHMSGCPGPRCSSHSQRSLHPLERVRRPSTDRPCAQQRAHALADAATQRGTAHESGFLLRLAGDRSPLPPPLNSDARPPLLCYCIHTTLAVTINAASVTSPVARRHVRCRLHGGDQPHTASCRPG